MIHSAALRVVFTTLAVGFVATLAQADDRLDRIKRRGFLICGVSPGVAGFSEVDRQGRYVGLDIDICRAVSAAIVGTSATVVYKQASSIQELLDSTEIDIVSRRLTWSLERESRAGARFGPITFYDGQGFLVMRRRAVHDVTQLTGMSICVEPGTSNEFRLGSYFRSHHIDFKKVLVESTKILENAFDSGRCDAYTTDVSELGSIRSKLAHPETFDILPEMISKEPLAQLVRADDRFFVDILRWTVFALIGAEELGISSENVDQMLRSDNPEVKRLLGITPGTGNALGLDDKWAFRVIKTVGNYGEIFERNLGSKSSIKLSRGLNRLWTAGGLMYAPPLR
jgi:general L-amino acid transport system substrate-binding protein